MHPSQVKKIFLESYSEYKNAEGDEKKTDSFFDNLTDKLNQARYEYEVNLINPIWKKVDKFYKQRNDLAQVAARLAMCVGYDSYITGCDEYPDCYKLIIELPTGQIKYHLTEDELIGGWDKNLRPDDYHTDDVQSKRIKEYLEGNFE